MKYILVSIIILLFTSVSFSQQDSISTLEDFLELVSDESLIDQEDSQILDLIELLLLYPVNINEANLQDLLIIPFIDANAAQRIIDYRNLNGSYFSKNELYNIDGLDENLILILKSLISVSNEKPKEIFTPSPDTKSLRTSQKERPVNQFRLSFRSRIINDLQERKGFTNDSYRGNSLKSYNRLRGDYQNKYSFVGLIEKDAGEESFTDFYSVSLQAKDILLFDEIIVGDYLSEFGQGLVLWSPYAFSKGTDAVATVVRRSRSLSQYTSSDENQFFRGVALQSILAGITFSGFYSFNNQGATITENDDEVSSLSFAGLHRTNSEIDKKDVLQNNTFALRADGNPFNSLNLSVLYLNSKFDKSITSTQKFGLNGDSFSYSSLAFDYIFKKLRFAGEAAYNGTSVAFINSLSFELTKKFTAIALVRSYPRNFSNLYGNAFGESSRTQNEFGIYTGFKWRTDIGNINFYFDQFKFPFSTNDLALPSTGQDFLIHYSNRFARGFFVNLRYKNELKEIDEEIDNLQQLVDRRIQNFRLELIFNVNRDFRLKSRAEYVNYNIDEINSMEEGYLFFQDARINLHPSLRIYTRFILFQTDSFNSRVYEFENDLTGVLSNPALFGEGIKWYVLLNYKFLDNFTLSMKYSELHKPNEKSLSSGLNEINGNTDNRLSLQIDYRL
jgi:hypothetical protein